MVDVIEYEKQVYAGVLGKTIGVYMGRPFEQWDRSQIAEKWGIVDRYVHEDQNVPLVVSDDDISGTLTFIRALEDSGLYEDTPVEAFGEAWLNYIMDHRTILWWGGYGMSTEHTAYLNLKSGVKAPGSGAITTNGAPVAEQIGAQIFIDAFGMVCPGNPELAASLAMRAASVAHDGEAVHAACVVAAMVSAAFIEKDMNRLLDIGVGAIPATAAIADVHRDVREWSQKDGDWETTYARIKEQYGYQNYGGSCHVIPNHALMVMAWAYAPDNFHKAQCIINSAGWDTDCNAANVGSVMGIKVGLDRINEEYEFQRPFGDRLIIPTAEGTRSVSDVANEALHLASIGRNIAKMPPLEWPKNGALYHFEMPGSQHGFLVEEHAFSARGTTRVENTVLPHDAAERG
ncbi:MAG: ADP-ribosylglycohydrolase family protein, partial [Candidatus Latescibacteria bacterium]|nr:ADP-ribosylglycohydrolase family protein [Candidatus Latescibacterota bacterium]